jgi:ribonuclease P protein component
MRHDALKFYGKFISVNIRTTYTAPSKLGITVTRRFGPAHKRNRFKRLTREAFRLSFHSIESPIDIVVRPSTKALEASLKDIQSELLSFTSEAIKILYPLKEVCNNKLNLL